MLEAVLHQRLEDERRDERLSHVNVPVHMPLQDYAVPEALMIEQVELIYDPDLLGKRCQEIITCQLVSEKIAQCPEDALGLCSTFLPCTVYNHVKGIEQEVGIDLAPELLQLLTLQKALKLQGFGFPSV